MIRLTKSQVLGMHHALIERYGGIHGVRDEGLLDSALQAPYQTFDDIELYDALTAAGMDVSPMVEPAPHVRFFFVKDPAGVSVQFM